MTSFSIKKWENISILLFINHVNQINLINHGSDNICDYKLQPHGKKFSSENLLLIPCYLLLLFMRAVIQRVSEAAVTIDGQLKSEIKSGLLILLGIEENDTDYDIDWLANKIIQLRIFSDADGKMNLSVQDINGDILVISQFTLFASTKKGNRPSFLRAAKPEIAIPLYEQFLSVMKTNFGKEIYSGEFGTDMKVELINDGPVTITIDSKNPE